ncbi:Alpha/Beta hydrolase protein [Fimicolochytrium jonesii]|uniref:Alpha/Beta hydrolase protein n=1 Tax=Fimicolochytrium jonesii TaxID=1396493 RepID=UPI0022FF2229|nr:Alpha/Beta hydrolase protein [Fimicolochytrium jonesii]KAI8818808.1 Alpha/Beta hydrolase protein [Fimicolochytrium jonesii]
MPSLHPSGFLALCLQASNEKTAMSDVVVAMCRRGRSSKAAKSTMRFFSRLAPSPAAARQGYSSIAPAAVALRLCERKNYPILVHERSQLLPPLRVLLRPQALRPGILQVRAARLHSRTVLREQQPGIRTTGIPSREQQPDENKTITLPSSGKVVSYATCGAPLACASRAAVYLHGFPGNRLESLLLHSTALAHNVHILAPDRPGFGRTPYESNRTVASYPNDHLLPFMDAVGIDKFSIVAFSGGGPYAAACLAFAPASLRVLSTVVVSGATPLAASADGFKNARMSNRLLFWFGRNMSVPWLEKTLAVLDPPPSADFMQYTPDQPKMKAYLSQLAPADRTFTLANFDLMKRIRVEAYALNPIQTLTAVAEDLKAYSQPLDLNLTAARNLHVFHGDNDVNIPFSQTAYWKDNVPHVTVTPCSGDAHWSVLGTRKEEIIRAALANRDESGL